MDERRTLLASAPNCDSALSAHTFACAVGFRWTASRPPTGRSVGPLVTWPFWAAQATPAPSAVKKKEPRIQRGDIT